MNFLTFLLSCVTLAEILHMEHLRLGRVHIVSPHLQVLPAFIHDVIHDYFTDLKLTLAEVASKDPKGFIQS